MPYAAMVEEAKKLSYEEQLNLMAVLVDLMKSKNKSEASASEKKDYSDTYHAGFFDLFGSNPDFPSEPDDMPPAEFSRIPNIRLEDRAL